MARKKSLLGNYPYTAFSTAPEAHARRLLWAKKITGSDDSEAGRRETEEEVRRAQAVREHVPPPKNVSLQETEALAFEEKATRVFPSVVEEARRKAGMAPYSAPPRGRSLDWWNKP